MRITTQDGFTLIELLMAVTIFGLMAAGVATLLSVTIDAQAQGNTRYKLYQEGLLVMERLTGDVKTTTKVHIPNADTPVRTLLALSSNVNEDNDYYFNDPLFPRCDEDGSGVFCSVGFGILGLDDNGNGSIDDSSDKRDEDEDGLYDEEILNGLDDDEDGNVDEDLSGDYSQDNASGIAGMDDNADGQVDEGNAGDDDEDGEKDEDPPNLILYAFDAPNKRLNKVVTSPSNGMTGAVYTALSERVTFFQATYETPDRILIELTLAGAGGETVTLSEYVCPRHRYQKTGKRVR